MVSTAAALPPTRQASRFALAGALLSIGAPLGLIALRQLTPRPRRSIRADVRQNAWTYAYVTGATAGVFALFGFVLGRRADTLVRVHEQVRRLQDEFNAVVAHDLRGPINALRLQSELLLEKAEGGEIRAPASAIERIRRATTDLARMTEDLLDAGRIESGRLRIDARPVPLVEAARDLIEQLRPALQPHPITVEGDAAPPALVDPSRFDQILTNLVDNACKYSPPEAPVRVSIRPAEGGVEVAVSDRGMGIAPADIPLLFDRFYQTRRARAQKSGLGLGLYITKGLVEAQRGRITVESVVDQGSTFRVWLPAA
jgi:signal transduction histidine kinase